MSEKTGNKKTRKSKSVEQKLWEAYYSNKGVRLSWRDVASLIHDDAVATRISNRAAMDAGNEMPLADCIDRKCQSETWEEFGGRLV